MVECTNCKKKVSYTLCEGSLCMPLAAETEMIVPSVQLTVFLQLIDYLLQTL